MKNVLKKIRAKFKLRDEQRIKDAFNAGVNSANAISFDSFYNEFKSAEDYIKYLKTKKNAN
jgi:hypothetical protein